MTCEGRSDVAAVAVLCAARGLDPADGSFALVDMGGVTNVGHHLARLRTAPGRPQVLGLCDAPEERFVVRAPGSARASWSTAATTSPRLGFVVCDRDLEDELIRALGPARVESRWSSGWVSSSSSVPSSASRSGAAARSTDQLRRFAGTASGRKALFARGLAEELTPTTHRPRSPGCSTRSPTPSSRPSGEASA